ncbi:hypothetical protein J3A83DRAFT_3177617 [Scleroderma citrinum]
MPDRSSSPPIHQGSPHANIDISSGNPGISRSDGLATTIGLLDVVDDTIPPTHIFRTLVLCFDGTGDQFDSDNSNIVQLFSMLKKDDPAQQMVYYQAGIGTYNTTQVATPSGTKLSKTIDMMVGKHLDSHVMDGYKFIMQNYEAGDKICLFGFSRGAYTARALAGMLHKVGLLPRCNHQQVPFAYKMYSRDDETGWKQSRAFKKAFSIDVDVEFVGVWDTVSSVGIIPRTLPFTRANNKIRYFRHALSLDERRARFLPNFYHRSTEVDNALGIQKGEMPMSCKKLHHFHFTRHEKGSMNGHPHEDILRALEHRYSQSFNETDVEEVWFSGCHCDVGGGSVENGTRYSLARIPLRWMIREIFKANISILFHSSMFHEIGLDPETLYPHVLKRPEAIYGDAPEVDCNEELGPEKPVIQCDPNGTFVNEEYEDLSDALSPTYDQLRIAPHWWVLEVLPQKHQFQKEDGTWHKKLLFNKGRGRRIPQQDLKGVQIKVHRTVKIRMEADGLLGGKYWPKAKLKIEPLWVD